MKIPKLYFLALLFSTIIACQDSTGPVDPSPRSSNLRNLPVGGVRSLSLGQIGGSVSIPSEMGDAEYLLAVSNSSLNVSDTAFYSVKGDLASDIESAIRRSEREIFEIAGKSSRQKLLRANEAVGMQAQIQIPAIGDQMNIKVGTACDSFVPTVGTVRAVSQRAIIVLDNAAPPGGFEQADFTAIANEFDVSIFPVGVSYFGEPTDIDNNGRVIIYYTPEVNKMTDPGAKERGEGYYGGYFFGADFYPTCSKSNNVEIFYLLTPDPTGVHGNVFRREEIRQSTRGTIAHEFQHMINFGNRYNADIMWESPWLDEALSHLAEEATGRALNEIGDLTTLEVRHFSDHLISRDDQNAFFLQNLIRFRRYISDPGTSSPIDKDVDLKTRGAAWSLLRHALDWYSGGSVKSVTRALVAGPETGVANFSRRFQAPFDTLLSRWYIALYADHEPIPNLGSNYYYRSYALKPIIRDYVRESNDAIAYPLPVMTIASGSTVLSPIRASSVTFYRSAPRPNQERLVEFRDESGELVDDAYGRVHILRLR